MDKFTKGKWIKEGSFIFSFEQPPRLIAEVIRSNMSFSEQQANARLISSVPDMYELLKRLVNNGWNAGISEEAKEILAKAKGKEV